MNAYVAVTDKQWFDHLRGLSRRQPVEEVNFWTPKPWGGKFGVLQRGQPLLFKLRSPHNAIVGGGFFEHYTPLPISLAWEAFGQKNGARNLVEVATAQPDSGESLHDRGKTTRSAAYSWPNRSYGTK